MSATVEAPASGPLLVRRAELVDVDYPHRTLELLVIPYETEIDVPHPIKPGGPRCLETIARGAFDGIERRANRVRANRDHDETRTFGRAVSFHPADPAGLRAEIKVARTELGDETLALADDGCLDASAGFRPMMPDGIQWQRSTAYRITKAWLRHIALVPDPAYEQAQVLAVRHDTPSDATERPLTPVLDSLRLSEWIEREKALDARWRVR